MTAIPYILTTPYSNAAVQSDHVTAQLYRNGAFVISNQADAAGAEALVTFTSKFQGVNFVNLGSYQLGVPNNATEDDYHLVTSPYCNSIGYNYPPNTAYNWSNASSAVQPTISISPTTLWYLGANPDAVSGYPTSGNLGSSPQGAPNPPIWRSARTACGYNTPLGFSCSPCASPTVHPTGQSYWTCNGNTLPVDARIIASYDGLDSAPLDLSRGARASFTNALAIYETTQTYQVIDLCHNVVRLPLHETFGSIQNFVGNNWPSVTATSFSPYSDGSFVDTLAIGGGPLSPLPYPPDGALAMGFCNATFNIHTPDEVQSIQQTFYVGSSQAGTTNGLATPVFSYTSSWSTSIAHSIGYYRDHGCPEDIDAQTHSSAFFRAIPPSVPGQNGLGQDTLYWCAPDGIGALQVWVGSAGGTGGLFAQTGQCGTGITGQWITNGLEFFLQDVTRGSPGSTLATVQVTVQ